MMRVDWIDPLGVEYMVIHKHFHKDFLVLINCAGWIREMPLYYLEEKWSRK